MAISPYIGFLMADVMIKYVIGKMMENTPINYILLSIFVYVYPPFTRKQIVSLSFERNACTHLRIVISKVSAAPVFPIKMGTSHKVLCPRTKQANLQVCSPQHRLNDECQPRKLWIPFFKLFWYDSTRGDEALVYWLQSGRSNHLAIASVTN